jgi:hypothetical protein
VNDVENSSNHVPAIKQRRWKRYLLTGCTSISWLCGVLFLVIAIVGNVNSILLPLPCYDHTTNSTINRIDGVDVPTIRVYRDLLGETRVVARNNAKKDICRFTASSYSDGFWPAVSANQQYVAFTSNLFVTKQEMISYFYIVDTTDGSYVRFVPENSEDVTSLSWSPDSNKLGYVSYSGSAGYWQTTYLNLITPQAKPIWRVSLGTKNNHFFGYLEWVDGGQTLRYGHDEEPSSISLVPPPPVRPFWCSVTVQGLNLQCIDK